MSLKVKNNYKLLGLSVASGLLLWLGWPPFSTSPVLFVALVPLLIIESSVGNGPNSRLKLFLLLYLSFLIWNTLSTYWIYHASPGGAVVAIVLNSSFMCIPFMLFNRTKGITDIKIRYSSLIFFWVWFEYLHMNWDASWPWLTLGNGFASNVRLVQWYEYTGVLGGTVWIWMVNIAFFKLFRSVDKGLSAFKMIRTGLLLVIPIIFSLYIYSNYTPQGEEAGVVIVQPNIDPYNEKFDGLPPEQQVGKMLAMAETSVDAETRYVVFPETAISNSVDENNFQADRSIQLMMEFIHRHPNVKIVTGASTYNIYRSGEKRPVTAKKYPNTDVYVDQYNTALYIDSTGVKGIYHKSKLVPGVEKMPFPHLLGFLEDLSIDMGGTSGSLGTQEKRTVFVDSGVAGIAPVICYESIYGDFVGSYFNTSAHANAIFIITNDGWWSNTEGYKQHLMYGTLRAIETRKHIVRSANTGISCIIDQRGNIHSRTGWWEPAVIKEKIRLNNQRTYYMSNGDYIGFFALWFSVFYMVLIFGTSFLNRKNLSRD